MVPEELTFEKWSKYGRFLMDFTWPGRAPVVGGLVGESPHECLHGP